MSPASPGVAASQPALPAAAATASLVAWKGLHVAKINFEGVTFEAKDPLLKELAQQADKPLDPAKVTASVRRLFASGHYRDIRVDGQRAGDDVTLIYVGTARRFVGKVTIEGVKRERLAALLEYATKLNPGTPFDDPDIAAGTEGIKQSLASNGYFQPAITASSSLDETNSQVNATYKVDIGPQARIGNVTLEGKDPGFTPEEFRKEAKLKQGKKVGRTR
jgi:outer membrane protein assembly factor BamA